jgi:hypothetical protein
MKYLILNISFLFLLSSCASGLEKDYTEEQNYLKGLDSDNFRDKHERIEILKAEVKYFSPVLDAEFELFNVNGFNKQRNTSVPGATSRDYKFVVKVDTVDIKKWTNGFVPDTLKRDEDWTRKIIPDKEQEWMFETTRETFIRPGENVTMIIYRKEGIIFKRILDL